MPIIESLSKSFKKLTELDLLSNFGEVLKYPVALLTVAGFLILLLVLARAKRIKFTPRMMTQIALILALSVVLDVLKIYKLPQGGSVTLGSMVPIILISLWYGPEVGFVTGILFGVISLILGPDLVHPVQLIFDYPLAFMLLGAAGFFKNNKYVGTVVAIILRFICHVVSGVVFFASYAPEGQSPLVYSMIYNGSYLGVELIICLVIIALLPLHQLRKAVLKTES